ARVQDALEQSEREEAAHRADLENALRTAGFPAQNAPLNPADDADIERRLHAFDRARADAEDREVARAEARPLPVIEADLAKLEALGAAQRLPGGGGHGA